MNDNYLAAEPGPRVNLAGPFPTLRCREIVKGLVDGIIETTTQCTMTPQEKYNTALMLVRGARIVTKHDAEPETAVFIAGLLSVLVNGGLDAVYQLVEVVTGQPLPDEAVKCVFPPQAA